MSKKQIGVLVCLLAGHVVILWLILNRHLDFLFNDAAHRIGPGTDFWAMVNSGKLWVAGRSIYGAGPGFGFRYFPLSAMTLFAGLGRLSYDSSYALWVGINEMVFGVMLFYIRNLITSARAFLIAVAGIVLFSPYYLEIYMGNATFLVTGLLIIAYYYYRNDHPLPFFILFVISILIKPIGLIYLPILLFRRQYGMLVLALVIVTGLTVPYFLSHPGDWYKFIQVNFETLTREPGFLVHAGNQGLSALLLRLSALIHGIPLRGFGSLDQLPSWNQLIIRLLPYMAVLTGTVLTWCYHKKEKVGVLFFVWSMVYLLGYAEMWEHSYVLLLFALSALYESSELTGGHVLVLIAALALPTPFALYNITLPAEGFHDPDWYWSSIISVVHHSIKPLLALGLFVVVGWQMRHGISTANID